MRQAIRHAEGREIAPPAPEALKAALAARAVEWREVLAGELSEARQLLRKILTGPIVCRQAREEREGWAVRGSAALY